MKLLIVICDRSITDKIFKLLNDQHVHYHVSCYAKGTANSEMLSYFGLAETEKELIISYVNDDNETSVMENLRSNKLFDQHGAVAFTIPMDGIGRKTLEYIKRLEEKDE